MNTITLDPVAIREIFAKPDIRQADALVDIYRLIYPDWDEIESIGTPGHSWPQCNRHTWGEICRHFQKLDEAANRLRAYDKQVMPGGLWLNSGLSATDPNCEELKDWEVRLCPVTYAKREKV